MRDNFPPSVVSKVAERAAYICSNPACNRATIGPSDANPSSSAKNGVAAHICAASPGGPRYDISQSPTDRKSIGNAIWLCPACASLIDKNDGQDYPPDHLRKWKHDHEKLMGMCLQGAKRIVFQFTSSTVDLDEAKTVTTYLQQKGVLFMPYNQELPLLVMESVKEIRTYLIQIQARLDSCSPLYISVDSIVHACRYYMNTTHPNAQQHEIEYGLGALRKVIGLNIGQICKDYSLSITGPLKDAIPI